MIACEQLDKLRDTIRWAASRSAFYRRRLTDIAALEDMAHLPFTFPGDLALHHNQFLCVSQSEVSRVVTFSSSGTTGKPKRVAFTAEDQERTIDFFLRSLPTFARVRERILIALPCRSPGSVGDLIVEAVKRLGATAIPHGPVVDPSQTLGVLRREGATCIIGMPVQLLALARLGDGIQLRSAVLCGDHVPVSIVQALRTAWDCEVFEHYGTTEMGLGGGLDCRGHCGYHLREDDLYFEIIDPDSGDPLPEGGLGEIVFTTLTRKAMPLIRYRTGDISRFQPGLCDCGAQSRRLDRVRNRIGEPAALGISMAELDDALFPIPGLTDFAATFAPGGAPTLTIAASVVPGDEADVRDRVFSGLAALSRDMELHVTVTREAVLTQEKRRIQVCSN